MQRGAFLCFTDDDCEPQRDWVEHLVKRLERGADAAAGTTLSRGGVLAAASEITAHAPAAAQPPDGSDLAFAPTNNLACTKAAFEATPFDESYPDAAGEDRDWCARLTAAGYVLHEEPKARIIHHQELTFGRFLRQQARYGRGAFRFRRNGGRRPLEPAGFYKALLGRAFADGLSLGLLVCVAQAATAAGFVQAWAAERVSGPGLTSSMRAARPEEMARDRDRNRRRRRQPMDNVERHADRHCPCAAPAQEQQVEPPVEGDQERQGASDQQWVSPNQPNEQDERCPGADPMAPAEIQSCRARMVFEYEPKPWHAAPEQISLRHARQRPILEVLSLNRWIEDDATSLCVEAHAELDVLHRGLREPLFVEPPKRQEDVTPDRAQPGPERRRSSSAFLVDVMVEEVPEIGDDALGTGIVIVGTEDRREARVVFESTANPANTSRCTSTSASTKTTTSPFACREPMFRAAAGPRWLGWSTTMTSSGGSDARRTASSVRSRVTRPSVAGITTVSVATCSV